MLVEDVFEVAVDVVVVYVLVTDVVDMLVRVIDVTVLIVVVETVTDVPLEEIEVRVAVVPDTVVADNEVLVLVIVIVLVTVVATHELHITGHLERAMLFLRSLPMQSPCLNNPVAPQTAGESRTPLQSPSR